MKIIKSFVVFFILTLITQIGGFIFLIYEFIHPSFTKKIKSRGPRIFVKIGFFSALYLFISLVIVPPIASFTGRVPLPFLFEKNDHLKPAKLFYGFANRHYVKPELKEEILSLAKEFCESNKVDHLTYLDANFPFIDGYPLHPHRSHNDGEKLDLSFIFKDKNKNILTKSPSLLGYGYVEAAKNGEPNKVEECEEVNKYYSALFKITSQAKDATFDNSLNKALLRKICKNKTINKVFIEPHLKTRLRLGGESKIKFHGCQAVRHDDHIHIQM